MTGWSKFVEFSLREAIKFARRIGTSDWPVYNAIVVSSKLDECFTGCILVIIHYKYRNAEGRFEGTYKQPFIFDNYANAYLLRYPGGSEFPVRVSPQKNTYSIPAEGKLVFTRVE
jgi:hypothetical protein